MGPESSTLYPLIWRRHICTPENGAVEGAALMDWTGTVKRVSRIAEEFHLVSNSSESSTEYRCKFSLKSALQYEIAFNLTVCTCLGTPPLKSSHRYLLSLCRLIRNPGCQPLIANEYSACCDTNLGIL
jgi:hypothetical protein